MDRVYYIKQLHDKHISTFRLCEHTMQIRSTNGAQISQSGHKFCWHSNGHFDCQSKANM